MSFPLHRLISCLAPAILLAGSAAGHGDVHDRLAEVDKLLRRNPDAPHMYVRRANLWRLDGVYDRALEDYHLARSLGEASHHLDFMEAETLAAAGRHAEALPRYERFLAETSQHPGALLGRARSLAAVGRTSEAVTALDAALASMASPDPGVLMERARLRTVQGPGHLADALDGLNDGIDILGAVPALVAMAVDLEVRLGRTDQALERIDTMLAGKTFGSDWLVMKARVLAAAGKKNEAADAYRLALSAIDALPSYRRSTPAMQQRVRDIEARSKEMGP